MNWQNKFFTDEFIAKINAMPVDKRNWELETIFYGWEWDWDWDFYRTYFFVKGWSEDQVALKRKEYFDNCRVAMWDNFGYIPYRFRQLTHLKPTWKLKDVCQPFESSA